MSRETFEVAQQHRLMAWLLPDYSNCELPGESFDFEPAMRVAVELVRIHENDLAHEIGSALSSTRYLLIGSAKPRKRITGTRAEIDDLEMNGETCVLKKVVEKLTIRLLGFAFAAKNMGLR